jgi:hypothetical protein
MNVANGPRNPINGRLHGEYTWCSACEQAHRTGRWEARGWDCPAGCGGTALDALPWEYVRDVNPHYPMVPSEGDHYLWHPQARGAPPGKRPALAGTRG